MSVPVFFRDEDSIRRCCNFIETWTCSITQQCSRVIAACHPDWRDVCKTLCHGNGHVILRLIVKPEIEVNPLSGIHRSINTVSNILKQKIAWHDLVAVSSLACTWMKLLQPIEKWNCLFFFSWGGINETVFELRIERSLELPEKTSLSWGQSKKRLWNQHEVSQ